MYSLSSLHFEDEKTEIFKLELGISKHFSDESPLKTTGLKSI